jgi:integrase
VDVIYVSRAASAAIDRNLGQKVGRSHLSKIRVQIVEGKYFEKPKEDPYTFSQLMDRYLKEHASRRAHYRRYVNMVTNVKTFFGNPKLSQITPKTIVAFKAKRYADGVMPATINRELAMLKKAFNLACREWEWAKDNPVCRVSMEKEQNSRDRWLTEQEEARLLMAAASWLEKWSPSPLILACGGEKFLPLHGQG